MSERERNSHAVVVLAVSSRAVILLLALATRVAAPPYDAQAALPPAERLPPLLQPLLSWDGQHMLAVARAGYGLEQLHAFLPLFPLLVARLADALQTLAPAPLVRETALALAALAISNACFVLAARLLLELGRVIFAGSGVSDGARRPDAGEATALTAAALFCIAPSGVFMSAAYSESLFSALSFAGMLAAEVAPRRAASGAPRVAVILLSAATLLFVAAAASALSYFLCT